MLIINNELVVTYKEEIVCYFKSVHHFSGDTEENHEETLPE